MGQAGMVCAGELREGRMSDRQATDKESLSVQTMGAGMSDRQEAFEERAAIIEFCSYYAIPRREAETIAAAQMRMTDDEAEFLMGSQK